MQFDKSGVYLPYTYGSSEQVKNDLVLTIFNEGAYLIFKSIFHKVLNLVQFDCEITIESVAGSNQY